MKKRICIDAGHGGHDPGALGPNGLKESDVALDVALRLGTLLHRYCEVLLIRSADVFLTLSKRAEIANSRDADLFLSVHCNSGPPGQGSGFEVWTSPGQTESDRFATFLYDGFCDKFPAKPRRQDTSDGDPDKESKFTVLTATKMPAALFELEFIHTYSGEEWLKSPANRQACAEGLADGVLNYLGLVECEDPKPAPPPQEPSPWLGDHKLLEIEALAIFDRMSLRMDSAREQARTEIEALFRK